MWEGWARQARPHNQKHMARQARPGKQKPAKETAKKDLSTKCPHQSPKPAVRNLQKRLQNSLKNRPEQAAWQNMG